MDDGIINREHPIDPWAEFTDEDLKEKKKDAEMLLADKKKLIQKKLEETKEKFKDNFEKK